MQAEAYLENEVFASGTMVDFADDAAAATAKQGNLLQILKLEVVQFLLSILLGMQASACQNET